MHPSKRVGRRSSCRHIVRTGVLRSWTLGCFVAGRKKATSCACFDLAEYGPAEAREFARDGDRDLLRRFASLNEPAIAMMQSLHCLVCKRDGPLRLALSSTKQVLSDSWKVPAVPGRFDEDASDVIVARLGDGAASCLAAARLLAWNEAQVARELLGRGEAVHVAELSDDGESGDVVDRCRENGGEERAEAFAPRERKQRSGST